MDENQELLALDEIRDRLFSHGVYSNAHVIDHLITYIANLEARLAKEEKCCEGGPQWGHAWDCPKCPD
jgi:hypothetical protein